jgi:hypothetical protein
MAITTAPPRSGRPVHHGQPIMIAVLAVVVVAIPVRARLGRPPGGW